MPTAPPAPVRFTTTTGCVSVFSICAASGRPTMSATPPGGKGTIMVTGFEGYAAWPNAVEAKRARKNKTARDIGLLLRRESNTLLQKLHFIGSLAARWRVKWRGTSQQEIAMLKKLAVLAAGLALSAPVLADRG